MVNIFHMSTRNFIVQNRKFGCWLLFVYRYIYQIPLKEIWSNFSMHVYNMKGMSFHQVKPIRIYYCFVLWPNSSSRFYCWKKIFSKSYFLKKKKQHKRFLFIRPSMTGRIMVYPASVRPSVRLSVRPSVRPSVRLLMSYATSNILWQIFFKF